MNENKLNGVAQYLKMLHIEGVKDELSRRIADTLGENAIEIILSDKGEDRLRTIPGIGKRRAANIHDAIEEHHGKSAKNKKHNEIVRSATIFFGSYGIQGWVLGTIIGKYGDKAVETIQENPYRLTEIEGFGFARADEVAQKMGVESDSPHRIKAGIIFLLESEADQNGHTCLPYDVLLLRSHFLLGLPNEAVKPVLDDMIRKADIISNNSKALGEMVSLPKYDYAERRIANKLHRLEKNFDTPSRTHEWGQKERHEQWITIDQSICYTDEQKMAIEMAVYNQVMILTGGPGTGKTTTLRGIIRRLQEHYLIVSLCAPTGKAAKRMTEATGMEAKTIHRLLEYHPEAGFRRNHNETLETDAVIVDEASMIDTMLMYHLVDAIPLGAKLIIIGDVDQLPSVGAGNVLHDLIKSNIIPVVRLTKIHRQAEGSLIIKNAHNVIEGKPLEINNQVGSDFYFIERNTDEEALGEVVTLTQQRIFKYFGSQVMQVLTPLRKNTVLGADSLNKYLQQALNPDALLKCEYNNTEFRDGDPVMQIKNDYNLMRFNGETGVVSYAADYGKRDKSLKIIFEDEKSPTTYENSDIRNLSLNYACTIHKSQGSEYDIVIIPLMPSAGIMQQRNLLYTAITRAKKVCILIGSKSSIRTALYNWHIKPRWTQLCELLSNS